jgi:hypothetical protein
MLLQALRQWYYDREEELEKESGTGSRVSDPIVIDVARKYGGVLTKTVLSFETRCKLERAGTSLERFVQQGEARKFQAGSMTVFDIPSARVHLLSADKTIIEFLVKNHGQASRHDLFRESGLSIEALEASLKRLETQALIHRSPKGDTYRLAAVS